jgi:predicted NBD/HSP70 family sugar kinase
MKRDMSNFAGWNNVNLVNDFSSRYNVPVFLDHDANCAALGEQIFGKYKDCKNVLYILCDRGVGAGLILDGEIFHGFQGMAGEMGHVSINKYGPLCECGNRGCLELYCSMVALENEYKSLKAEDENSGISTEYYVSADEILRRVRTGSDPIALKCYTRIVKNLAIGTAGMINLLNPELVIFADQIINGGESVFLPIVNSTLKQILLKDIYDNITVGISSMKDDPALVGAGVMAFDKIFSSPLDL